ncbi:MAG TPA: TIGR03085 family metal-binding protein [Trebonia sp.]
MTYSRDERLALAALLEETGPEAPTLCAGWHTKDLAAHVVMRERRPDAGVGMLGGPLAGYTRRVQQGYLDRYSYPQLIAFFRSGPPPLSPFAIPGADKAANTVEYFVHHEDVRRGSEGWAERELPPGLSDALWKRLKSARLFLRGAPTGVALVRGGGETAGDVIEAKNAPQRVEVAGTPAELTLWSMGRVSAANVTFEGRGDAIERLRAWRQ